MAQLCEHLLIIVTNPIALQDLTVHCHTIYQHPDFKL
jgi:hypothetical protein